MKLLQRHVTEPLSEMSATDWSVQNHLSLRERDRCPNQMEKGGNLKRYLLHIACSCRSHWCHFSKTHVGDVRSMKSSPFVESESKCPIHLNIGGILKSVPY